MRRAKPEWDPGFQAALVNIGLNMKAFRKDKGLTQKELGDLAELDLHSISRFEKARIKPDLQSLSMIASALGRELADFFEPAVRDEEHQSVTVPNRKAAPT
jgi:transcriptional regulator with XRE-family HTH domain